MTRRRGGAAVRRRLQDLPLRSGTKKATVKPSPRGSAPSPKTPDWQPLALSLGYTLQDIPRLQAIREEWDRRLARRGAQLDPEYLDAQWRVVLELGL